MVAWGKVRTGSKVPRPWLQGSDIGSERNGAGRELWTTHRPRSLANTEDRSRRRPCHSRFAIIGGRPIARSRLVMPPSFRPPPAAECSPMTTGAASTNVGFVGVSFRRGHAKSWHNSARISVRSSAKATTAEVKKARVGRKSCSGEAMPGGRPEVRWNPCYLPILRAARAGLTSP